MADENPFADVNPFAAPAQPSQQPNAGLDDYNPFAEQQAASRAAPVAQPPPVYQPQPTYTATPATIETTRAEPTINAPQSQYNPADAQLKARQQELEKKAADLARREQELANLQQNVEQANNFPPLPKFCCVQPCFYHDITVEIPIESQRLCRMVFYVWELYVFVLLYNLLCSLSLMLTGGGATTFGVALLWTFLNVPCSFVCWYRPVYKAFKNDSSFNYMVFFSLFFVQAVITGAYAIGIGTFGSCGWINAATELDRGNEGVAAMMFICGALWTVLCIFMVIILKRTHGIYRMSGASVQKAQGEFARGVMTNKNVQSAAAEAVRGGISAQVTQTQY